VNLFPSEGAGDAMRVPGRWGGAPVRLWLLAAVYVVVCVLAGAALVGAQRPALAFAALAFLTVVLVALWHAYAVATGALVVCAFAPDYLRARLPFTVLPLNGSLVLAAVLLVAGVVVVLRRPRPALGWWAIVPIAVALAWLLGPLAVARGGVELRIHYAFNLSVVEVCVLVGAVLISSTAPGRLSLLRGFSWAGALAGAAAMFETLAGKNVFLSVGMKLDPGLTSIWYVVPRRLGLWRASVAFGHPIELGVFLGLGVIATLELARRRVIGRRTAIALIVLMAGGMAVTISRGPVVALLVVVLCWALVARRMVWLRRATLAVVVLATAVFTLGTVATQTDVVGLFAPGPSEPGITSEHRYALTSAFFAELQRAPVFGYVDPDKTSVAQAFGTVDHEGLYILLGRGLFGLAVFSLLFAIPFVAALLRRGRMESRLVSLAIPIYVVLCGMSVAFFGLLVPFVMVAAGLAWGCVKDIDADV